MNLTHDAMLVSLRINSWSGRLYDRQASQQVAVHNDADTNAGRYNKRLLPKQAFAALAATMNNARTSHNANTLPWDDQGGRLLTVANYDRYTAALDSLVERMVRERARFIEDYDDYVDQARLDLGRLFRLEDYPGTEALHGKFAIRYRIVPVPTRATSWPTWPRARPSGSGGTSSNRSGPASTMLSAISTGAWARRSSVSANACARTRTASRWCSATSLIENIRELVDVVPRLNIFADDDLTMLCREVKEKVRRHRAGRPAPLGTLRSQPPPAGQARRRCAQGAIRRLLRARRPGRAHPKQGSSMMAAHASSESARRVSDCVTALLRDQPFFGSLALRLPIRPRTQPARPLPATARTFATRPNGWRTPMPTDQDRAGARGPGLCAQASHLAGWTRPGAVATGLAVGHPRPAARCGLRPAARGRSLGRHQRRAGLPAR